MIKQNAGDDAKGCIHNVSVSPAYVYTHTCISICEYVVFNF